MQSTFISYKLLEKVAGAMTKGVHRGVQGVQCPPL